MSNKVEAAMGGQKCTCTSSRDATEGNPLRIDPDCPFHGGPFGREQVEPNPVSTDASTGEDTGHSPEEFIPVVATEDVDTGEMSELDPEDPANYVEGPVPENGEPPDGKHKAEHSAHARHQLGSAGLIE